MEDQRRFFGRDREIEELGALVMSHNVVLVYAASGAGKSSLLDAGVVPVLVDEGFEVLPRGRLGVQQPLDTSLDERTNPYVHNLLCSLSPETAPTELLAVPLADRLRAMSPPVGAAGRVLVIDQAEELFTFTPTDWQRRQREFIIAVRDALRDAPDLRVVIVTREDYLAQFDDLAPMIPDGLRVRLHLEPLTRAAARRAVDGPLIGTHRRFESSVAERLVLDLSRTTIAVGSGTREEAGPFVEPVQLQIVCSSLWDKLPAGVEVITIEHLQRFGDVEETLERFYDETVEHCVAATGIRREQLISWVARELITPSNTRGQVFRGATETEGLPNSVVAFLESRHLLHADDRASGRWYELAHDRLIRPIRSVNERWSRKFEVARARRRLRRRLISGFVGGAGGIAVAFAAAMLLQEMRDRDRERALTVGAIDALRRECSLARSTEVNETCRDMRVRVFDFVADYYWRQGRTDELVQLLKLEEKQLIPRDYGMPAARAANAPDAPDAPDVLRIEYHPDRHIDEWRMRSEWGQMARKLGETRGIPVSWTVALIPNREVPREVLRIAATPRTCPTPAPGDPARSRDVRRRPGASTAARASALSTPVFDKSATPSNVSVEVTMPGSDGEALISSAQIERDARLHTFFREHSAADGWRPYSELQLDGPWWIVPAWTLPIWRVAGHHASSREAVLATMVADVVIEHPQLAINCDALIAMLDRAREAAPLTVAEAVSARTLEGLRRDLIEVGRTRGAALAHPSLLLDVLADYPELESVEAVARVIDGLPPRWSRGGRLHGPWRTDNRPAQLSSPRELAKQLSGTRDCRKQPIEIELDASLEALFLDGDGRPNRAVGTRIGALRASLHTRYGVAVPDVRFARSSRPGMRIKVLAQDPSGSDAQPLPVATDAALDELVGKLDRSYRSHRAWWVTVESMDLVRAELTAAERSWIDRHYSLTDLKRIARAVIAQDDPDSADTLRHLPWLLRALVFWRGAAPPADFDALASGLRDVQRISTPDRTGTGGPLRARTVELVRGGLIELLSGRPDAAEASFVAAVQLDREGAIRIFLGWFRMLFQKRTSDRLDSLAAKCKFTREGDFSLNAPATTAYELDEAVANHSAAQAAPALRRTLELCRAAHGASQRPPLPAAQIRLRELLRDTPSDDWTAAEAIFLARSWLAANHRTVAAASAELTLVRRVFARGASELDGEAGKSMWTTLQGQLDQHPLGWVRDLVADLAQELPATAVATKWSIAEWLGTFGELEIKRSLKLLDGLGGDLDEPARWLLAVSRAALQGQLGSYGDVSARTQQLRTAEAQLRRLIGAAPDAATAHIGWIQLAGIYLRLGDDPKARRALDAANRVPGDEQTSDESRFMLELGDGDLTSAAAIAARMVKRAPQDISTLFVNGILATLTARPGFDADARAFIFHDRQNPHPHADYMRMMLFRALVTSGRSADADQRIAARMATIQIDSWPARLEQRDTRVWREMLIAYFGGAISEDQLLGPLRDSDSLRDAKLDRSGLTLDGLRCEAYFYVALRLRVTGPIASREQQYRDYLARAVATQHYAFYEHRMARFLLSHPEY